MIRSLAVLAACWTGAANAHSFGQVYTLPVPFWLYAWSAAAALILSFVVLGIFLARPGAAGSSRERDISTGWPARLLGWLVWPLRLLSVAMLILCMATGWWGTPSLYANFNMTFFWILFALGFAWFCVLFGNFYTLLNPWLSLASLLGLLSQRYRSGLLRYPRWMAYWPALLLYMGFIWTELLARNTPALLADLLGAYTLLNLVGAGLFGIRSWFRYCEFFAVLFGLLSALSPLRIDTGYRGAVEIFVRRPLQAAVRNPVDQISLLLFLLFLLSSTAFDGLHEALIWYRLYWVDVYHCCLQHVFGTHPFRAYPNMLEFYRYWQTAWLLASPLIYFLAYILFIWMGRLIGSGTGSMRALALQFAPSLIPIAVVYHVSHYFTLLMTQGGQILRLASDPFGRGWNIFGTADWMQRNYVPDAALVWHTQVGLIVGGHVLSVWMAHMIAVRIFPARSRALLSQLPMLALMVLFTVAGLWILSLPNMAPG